MATLVSLPAPRPVTELVTRHGGAENHDSTSTMQDHSVVDTVTRVEPRGWDVAVADVRGAVGVVLGCAITGDNCRFIFQV